MTPSFASQADNDLIARVVGGEQECFAELVRRYQGPLLRVAASRLGRRDWADDVVQETFLAAFRACGSYDPQYSFRTWLWTILLNQCNGHYQRRVRSVTVTSLSEPATHEAIVPAAQQGDDSPLVALLAEERSEQLETLLNRLPLVQADALRLRFFGELKFHEIAEAMGCSLNGAKSRVRSGLERMAELIESEAARDARYDEESRGL